MISASLQVASAIASRTRRLRVGTAVQVLPLNHPLRIAEEVATVDHISEGRFEFGIGRSGVVRTYDVYGVAYAESQARFREALEIIRLGWKGEPFSYTGQFYRVDNATVVPRPYQTPHPPIRMATTSDETFPLAGRLGLPIFVGLRTTEIPDLQDQLAPYRQAWREAGHPGEPSVYLRIPVYVSTTAAGRDGGAAREHVVLLRAPDRAGPLRGRSRRRRARGSPPDAGRADGEPDLRRRAGQEGRVRHPAGVIDRLTQLREELGLDGIVAELNPGGRIPPELETQSLRLLTHEVVPCFRYGYLILSRPTRTSSSRPISGRRASTRPSGTGRRGWCASTAPTRS